MPDLYQYMDYRDFMRDSYEAARAEHAYMSYRYIGNHVGMDCSYLIRVLQGKKHISEDILPRFTQFYKFNEAQTRYFENLVGFNKAKTETQARAFFDKLQKGRGVAYRHVDADRREYFAQWYHAALRSLLDFQSFTGDYAALGKCLSPVISGEKVKASLFLLERLGMIERQPKGYKVLDEHLHSGARWESEVITQYQETSLRLAMRSLQKDPRPLRDISTMTMNINATQLADLRALIEEFQDTVAKMVGAEEASDRVYQLNVQLFPMSQVRGDSPGSQSEPSAHPIIQEAS